MQSTHLKVFSWQDVRCSWLSDTLSWLGQTSQPMNTQSLFYLWKLACMQLLRVVKGLCRRAKIGSSLINLCEQPWPSQRRAASLLAGVRLCLTRLRTFWQINSLVRVFPASLVNRETTRVVPNKEPTKNTLLLIEGNHGYKFGDWCNPREAPPNGSIPSLFGRG